MIIITKEEAAKVRQKFEGEIMLKGSAEKVWVALQGNDGREYGP